MATGSMNTAPQGKHARTFSLAAALLGAWLGAAGGCKPRVTADNQPPPSASAPLASRVVWAPDEQRKAIDEGRAVLLKHQCNRCHEIDDLPAAARPLHCTSCHTFLLGLKPESRQYKEIDAKYGEGLMARYQKNIEHLDKVPSLTQIGRRVRGDWLRGFLAEPYDVRPALEEGMIRHTMSQDEQRAVVRYFAAVASAADPYAPGYQAPALPKNPGEARIEEGKKLYMNKGCGACHQLGNLDLGLPGEQLKKAGPAAKLAPNLRFVRERTHPEVLLDWLMDPQRIAPGTLMPALGLTREEAEKIRDFLHWTDPKLDRSPWPEPQLPPATPRPVSYEEMKEEVLGKVCVHCHMNDYEKDDGPGNGGGFGYKGIKLAMRTYETLVQGAVDAQGQRYSVLVPRPGEQVPPILQSMLRRRVEEARDHLEPGKDRERPPYPRDGHLGMPMGLPAMTDAQIGLLRAWIEQGCKGPTRVTGRDFVVEKDGSKTAVNDGLLVPDGPLKKNSGCELRGPEQPRPTWSYEHNAATLGSASASAKGATAPRASAP
ncbi:MAG: c-type cytochrome [Polyangiaceae bacterium]|jgi:mono/diheme cytochrome c family protein|nr:c-type cytochrome [Polyangiaceae bacterium]